MSACNAGDLGSIPGSGRSRGEGNGNTLQYSCGESHGQRSLVGCIDASDTREDDEDYKNPVDLMFDRLAERDPEHFAVKQYAKYKLAAGAIS